MKTLVLALTAAAALGVAAPALAGPARDATIEKVSLAQDFSSHHRHHWRPYAWHRHHHHWRHCDRFWRHGHRVIVCG